MYFYIRRSLNFEWQISKPINHSSTQPYLRHRLIIKYTCGPESFRWRKSLCSSILLQVCTKLLLSQRKNTADEWICAHCLKYDSHCIMWHWFLLCIVKARRGTEIVIILPKRWEKFPCAIKNISHRSHLFWFAISLFSKHWCAQLDTNCNVVSVGISSKMLDDTNKQTITLDDKIL